MAISSVESQGFALVANGAFNPAIFHPSWLRLHEIISADELAASEVEVTHKEISQFSIPGVSFNVQGERLAIQLSRDPFVRALDVFLQIFSKLPETPISSLGLNYFTHVALGSWEKRQKLGRALAPVEPWGDFGKTMESNDIEIAGGLTSLTMRAMWPDLGKESQIGVTIQPSAQIETPDGIYLNVNHHMKPNGENSAPQWCKLIDAEFDNSVARSREIVSNILKFVDSL